MKRKKCIMAVALTLGIMGIGGLTALAASGIKELSATELSDVTYNNKIYTYAIEKQYETENPDEKPVFEEKVDGLKLAEVEVTTIDTVLQKKTLEESKDYKNLLEKDESKIKESITIDGKTYKLQNIAWTEEPNMESVSYTLDLGYAADAETPDYPETYIYTYTSPVTKKENTVSLPFVRMEQSDYAWVDGFTATVTFHNLEGEYFKLGSHEFAYDPDKLTFTESDFAELVKMLGYDTSKYRLNTAAWSSKPYKGGNGELYRDALASGQQYAASFKAIYEDEVENGKIYTAHATYVCEVEVPAEEAAPTYVMKAVGYYETANVWTNIITFVTEHKAVSAITSGILLFTILIVAVFLINRRKNKTVYAEEKIREGEE